MVVTDDAIWGLFVSFETVNNPRGGFRNEEHEIQSGLFRPADFQASL